MRREKHFFLEDCTVANKSFFDELAQLPGSRTTFRISPEGREVRCRVDGIRTTGVSLADFVKSKTARLSFDGESKATGERDSNSSVPGKMLVPHILAAEKAYLAENAN